MPRQKKDFKMLNMKVASNVMDRFNVYCEKVGQTKTLAFERIVTEYLNQYDEEQAIFCEMKERNQLKKDQ